MKELRGAASADSTIEQKQSDTQTNLQKVLVYDTIQNIWLRDKYKVEKSSEPDIVFDPPLAFPVEDLINAPRNSILGWPIGESGAVIMKSKDKKSKDKADQSSLNLYYPLFSSHFSLPVKPGEHVFVMSTTEIGYWVTRVPERLDVEDVNYTHSDRRHRVAGPSPPAAKPPKVRVPGFQNGEVDETADPKKKFTNLEFEAASANFQIDDQHGYDNIVKNTKESELFVAEPVPRFTKRPGDLVLQGSHNSAIILGTDRGYGGHRDNRPVKHYNNSIPAGLRPGLGAIDIVVGRGRMGSPVTGQGSAQNLLTRPRTIENSRGELETDKDATTDTSVGEKDKKENRFIDIPEGDPDFINDAARIYISMGQDDHDIDSKLGIDPTIDGEILRFGSAPSSTPRPTLSSASMKADRIRIVARRTGTATLQPSEARDINVETGDIRIIKQGQLTDDACAIYLENHGQVHIGGKIITMGRLEDAAHVEGSIRHRNTTRGIRHASDYGGPGPSVVPPTSFGHPVQPYIRFSDLKKLFTELFAALDTFTTTLQTHVTPGSGGPAPQINTAASDLQGELARIKDAVGSFDKLGSTRIFGE